PDRQPPFAEIAAKTERLVPFDRQALRLARTARVAGADARHQADLAVGGLEAGAKIEVLDMQEETAVEAAQRPIVLQRQEHGSAADGRHHDRRDWQIALYLDPRPARNQTI